ncbi:tail fiber protein [Pseudomonas phage PaGz-1]|uniref:Tail fiber protein n=1 Tax=Pseudomonas phage PaGz-1 TaxID=2419748 RepID=A0A411B9C2_9CAUD|nr:tail fiber protein [Pseudomonas phage PaGz-1]QAX98137.1 tail fiber protein [Pseudomonas phage PaGz-1]
MADYGQLPIENIWSTGGDMVAPTPAQQQGGWGIQSVPRQWWNWKWNLHDTNLAYLLQKGIPEWTSTQEYIANKSFCTRNGFVYKAVRTHTGSDPATVSSNWVRAFADFTTASSALGSLTPREGGIPFFISASGAGVFDSTAYGRGMLNVANAAGARNYISAQESSVVLSNLSTVTRAANAVPYFNTDTSMATFNITAFGRGLVNAGDATNARTFLGLANSATITADPANRAHTLVYRDAAGNFDAGVITATLSGNATTASKLRAPVTINGVAFDGSQNIVLPGLDTSYAGVVARLHINGANMTGTDKTTQLALRNKSDTDWISLVTPDDSSLVFQFRGPEAANATLRVNSNVVFHAGNQYGLGATQTQARERLMVDRLAQSTTQTMLYNADKSRYFWLQDNGVSGIWDATTNTPLWRFSRLGQLDYGTVPVAQITGLANSATIPASASNLTNQIVVRSGTGDIAVQGVTAFGAVLGTDYIRVRASTGNAHLVFQRNDGAEVGLIWGIPSANSLNFRTAGGATGMSLAGQDLTVVGRVNAATLNSSGNVNSGNSVIAAGNVQAAGRVYCGDAFMSSNGNLTGGAFGSYGTLTNWVDSVYARKTDVMTDAQILAATSRGSAQAVGTYVFAIAASGSGDVGTVVAGTSLRSSSPVNYHGTTLSGSYRCMGRFGAGGSNRITLFQKVAD